MNKMIRLATLSALVCGVLAAPIFAQNAVAQNNADQMAGPSAGTLSPAKGTEVRTGASPDGTRLQAGEGTLGTQRTKTVPQSISGRDPCVGATSQQSVALQRCAESRKR